MKGGRSPRNHACTVAQQDTFVIFSIFLLSAKLFAGDFPVAPSSPHSALSPPPCSSSLKPCLLIMLSPMTRRCYTTISGFPLLRASFSKASRHYQAPFLASCVRDASSLSSSVAEAFSLPSGTSPAEASRPPNFGTVASAGAAANVHVIRDMDAFEVEVYRQPHQPLAIFFSAKCAANNKQLLEQFSALAASTGSNVRFLVVDVDEIPRAAYHCGVSARRRAFTCFPMTGFWEAENFFRSFRFASS